MENTFENACVVGDNIYFFSYEVNGLFKIDMKKEECKYIDSLKKYDNKIRLFGDLIYVNGKIILAPMLADDFVIYDLEERTAKYIPVEKCDKNYCSECKFFAVIHHGIDVYFIGCHYPAIVKLNLLTEKVVYYTDWLKNVIGEGYAFFRRDYHIENEKILLACSWTNQILSFDMKSGECAFLEIGSKKRKYAGIISSGKNYWLTPLCDNIVVKWDSINSNYNEIAIQKDVNFVQRGLSYAQGFVIDDYIVILPLYDYPICVINTKTEKIKTIFLEQMVKKRTEVIAPIRGGFVYKKNLYIVNSFDSKLYALDLDKMRFNEMRCDISKAYKEFFANKNIRSKWNGRLGKYEVENMENDLNILIKVMQENLLVQTENDVNYRNLIGKKIFKELRR